MIMERGARAVIAVVSASLITAATIADGAAPIFARVGDDVAARFFHAAGPIDDGVVLVTGGMRLQFLPPSLISLSNISFYDARSASFSSSWTPTGGGADVTPVLATARSSHTQTTLIDGRVLITGGRTGATGTDPGAPVASVELFDPVTGAVSAGPAMSTARAAHTATRLPDGRVVVAGGGSWQVFTPGTPGAPDAWSSAHALERSRSSHAAVLLPDYDGPGAHAVLVIGGAGNGGATIERLDPDDGSTVLATPTLNVAVDDLAAVRLASGAVLIVGGQNLVTGDTIAHSYLYDPVADELEDVDPPPDLDAGISDHVMIAQGNVAVIAGGEQQLAGTDTVLRYAALYDGAADHWTPLPSMVHLHDDFAAARVDPLHVLMIDGGIPFLSQETPTASVERLSLRAVRPFDLDGNRNVGFSDLVILLNAWGPCAPAASCVADLNFSGSIGFEDLVELLTAWGPCG